MLPIKTRSVFKSRWVALLWAGGILWTAADFAGGEPHRATGAAASAQDNADAAADAADVQAAVNALDGIK
ncbi:hypothetical protein HZF05_20080 [Sphingomonas sp. CGMCC 1.13654]|uniref:Uncharacterized protein n=1 Tax=Sphingomonas chungangi TaxID=2683589 RepID=A0A838LBI0_9SPHN|nr:hypothetical protein [Sphingomonas chungangi]MBA2936387.1 hypothetical protein [Sphingomonas chungangi]MVW55772.1 hypothetical protein [Sphingomonas chungangi]